MIVQGYEIPHEVEAAALSVMTGTFTAKAVEGVVWRMIVSDCTDAGSIAMRTADRLLQRERSAGRIQVDPGNKRRWIAAKLPAEAPHSAQTTKTPSG